jgi:hypothetical protein
MQSVLQERSDRRRDVIALGLLVLLLSAVYFDVLFLGNNFFTRDLTIYHYPMKKVVRDTVLAGELPLWNPRFAGGQPMAANPAYEVFYPPQWLTLIPDYNLGFRLHILFHVYAAAIGAFLFLRSRGVRRAVALLGGSAFVLCGPFVSVFNLLPFMFSVAWTPWIALFGSRFFERRRRRDLVMLILFVGLQVLVSEPTTLLQTWFLLGFWAAWRGWTAGGSDRLTRASRNFVEALGIVVAGVVLAAVQFLPALDHAADSVRRSGFRWETVSQWSFPPLRFVEVVYPSFLGLVETGGPQFWGHSLYRDVGGPYLYSVYVGLPFVALALAGLLVRRTGSGFAVFALATSFVLAMGSWTPVLRWVYEAGLLPSIRYPEKFILMGAFVLLAWGCLVLEDVLAGDRAARLTVILLGLSAAVAAAVFAWSFSPSYAEWFTSFWSGANDHAAAVSKIHWLVAAVRGAAFLVAIEIARRTRTRAAMALLVLVLIADLGPLGNQVNPRMPRRFFDEPQATAEVAKASSGARMLHLAWLDRDTDRFLKISGGYDSYWMLRNALIPILPSAWGISTVLEWDVDETHLVHTREFLNYAIEYMRLERADGPAWRADAVRQIVGMCNVGVIASIREGAASPRAARDWEQIDPVVFDPVRGGDRYYFASEVVRVDGPRQMFENMVRREWPRDVAFVYEGDAVAAPGAVRGVEESSNVISLDVEATGDSMLVASVTRHKYWQAAIDGREVPIHAVNHAFQGVHVPEGRHVVTLRYRNPLVPAGAAVSLTMLAGLVAAYLARRLS